MPLTKPQTTVMIIPPIEIKKYVIRIVGDTPLIVHAWSAKAKAEMLGKQMGTPRAKRAVKDPKEDYEAAFYRLASGVPAFPTIAFKAAAVDAATQVAGLTKTFVRGTFHAIGELVEIEGVPRMREDTVRIGIDTADLRYRPEFVEWAVNLKVQINARAITLEQLVHLFNQAGFSVGVGEWRPAKDGRSGMFHVESVQEV